MSKFISINKNQATVFGTLLVLIVLGAVYFFVYIPDNEQTVQARRFICLQNIDNNIHAKIDNGIEMLNNLVNAPENTPDDLNNYAANYPKSWGTLFIGQSESLNGKTVSRIDSQVNITADISTQLLTLQISRIVSSKNAHDSLIRNIGIRYRFDQFINKLLPPDVFDGFIVFANEESGDDKGINIKSHNRLVYQTFPSGLSYKAKDSLLQFKNGISSPGVRNITIGGTDYKAFSQPVNIGSKSVWIIEGLITAKNYQKEKTQLPLGVVLLLLTLAIGAVILLPWIKLYQMGNKDKLTVSDGIASVLVSMLCMSLLFFVFFKYTHFSPVNPAKKKAASSINTLATKIVTAFSRELDDAYWRLSKFDSLYRFGKIKTDINGLGQTNPNYRNGPHDTVMDGHLKEITRDMAIDQVYWLNKLGEEVNNWTTGNQFEPRSRLASRDYFKRILNDRPYLFNGNKFYVQPVVSRSDGTFQTVIAKASTASPAKVAAMTFTMKCLDNAIMPDGYQFAIIDTTGEVLYHSHPERNLNENLNKEFADSTDLVSCLVAKSDTNFTTEYYGRQYNVKIMPITGLPYLSVIFEDSEYNDARDREAYAFTLGMLLLLLIFLIVQIGIVFFVSAKRSFFKKQLFDTSWIGPKINSHHQYNIAILSNFVVIILLIVFFSISSFLAYIFIILFSITFIAIFLNGIFAMKYKAGNHANYLYKIFAVGWLLMFVVAINASAAVILSMENMVKVISYEILLPAICMLLYNLAPRLLKYLRHYKHKYYIPWSFTHSFALMATTRLLITSGLPIAFFFVSAYNYQQGLNIKYRQLIFARAVTQKIHVKNISAEFNQIASGTLYRYGLYTDSIYIKSAEIVKDSFKVKHSNEEFASIKILNAFRLFNSPIEIKSKNLNFVHTGNEATFSSGYTRGDSLGYQAYTYYKAGAAGYIRLGSADIDYPPLNFPLGTLLLISIIIFYYILHNIIRKLFALNLPSRHGWETMDKQLQSNNQLNRLLFILGSPGSGKLTKLTDKLKNNKFTDEEEKTLYYLAEQGKFTEKDKLEEEFLKEKMQGRDGKLLVYNETDTSKNNVFIADMILISAENGEADADWKKCKEQALSGYSLVIINHFEYNIKDYRANNIKLDFLESLMQRGTSKIAIISTVHPLSFLDSFTEQQGVQVLVSAPPATAGQPPANNRIPESELERWQVLLGHFRIVVESLQVSSPKNADELPPLERTIVNETKYSHYLNAMQQMTLDSEKDQGRRDGELVSDSLIFKLQITSHYFYTYIWQSLTKEEKFLLYDLAEDGLVNPFDDYNLSMLLCKGLIIKPEGTLMLFNKGFRNFILTAIGNTELNRIKAQVKDNGKWSNLKTPLNLAIVAILAFLIVSQQESYTHIITYITALGAGIPVVLRIFTLLGNGGDKQKAT